MITEKDRQIAANVALDCAVDFCATVTEKEMKINETANIFFDFFNKYNYTQDRINIQACLKRAIKYCSLNNKKTSIKEIMNIATSFFNYVVNKK